MQTFILRNNVLTDNTLLISDIGKVFKGRYKAILKEYSFLNEWNDKESIRRFRKIESLQKYLAKNYTEIETANVTY